MNTLRMSLALSLALLATGCPQSSEPAPLVPDPAPTDPTPDDPTPSDTTSPSPDTPEKWSLEGNRVVLPGPFVFTDGGTKLDESASKPALEALRRFLEAKKDVTLVRIEGHGDQPGRDALMATGEQALQVGRWLVAHGIGCERLKAAAFGDTKPIAAPDTPEGRSKNRRVEAITAQLRGRAIGGMPEDGDAPESVPVCD